MIPIIFGPSSASSDLKSLSQSFGDKDVQAMKVVCHSWWQDMNRGHRITYGKPQQRLKSST